MPNEPMGVRPGGSGPDTRTAALVSYFLLWISGLLILFTSKDPDARYHGAQSTIVFGVLTVITIILSYVPGTFPFALIDAVVRIAILLAWLYCLYQAWTLNGARFEIPGVGPTLTPYVERLAASVHP